MKTILVMTDFSVSADHAAHYALKLAQKIEANLLLCNVFFVPAREATVQVTWPAEEYKIMEDNSKLDLRLLTDRLNKQLVTNDAEGKFKPTITYRAKSGDLTEIMNEIVYHGDIIMAVISAHNADGLNTFLLGNHTREIIEKADCPVLIIPHDASFKNYEKIAFATDLSQNNIDVLQCLTRLAEHTNAEILITHVGDEKTSDKDEQVVIKHFFTRVSNEINYPKIYYRAVKNKSISAGLEWLTEHGDLDMLVMVHRKRSFLGRLIDASITQKMADHATKPLLVFPSAKVIEILPVF